MLNKVLAAIQHGWVRVRVPLYWGLIIAPFVLSVYYTYHYGVNILFGDEFALPDFLSKVYEHRVTWSDWFAQNNEHRIFFPRLVFMLLASISQYDTRAELFFINGLLIANGAILLMFFKKHIRSSDQLYWFIPAAWMIVNLRQYENLLWGFQLSFIMPLTFALIAFLACEQMASKERIKQQLPFGLIALTGATVASFSSAMGLMVWPALIMQLAVMCGRKKEQRIWFFIFAGSALAEWMIYFHKFIAPDRHPAWDILWRQPLTFIEYYLVCLGNIINDYHKAMVVGGLTAVVYLVMSMYLFFKRQLHEYGLFVGLSLFVLAMVFSVTFGRSGFGIDQGLASRYTTYTLYFYIVLYLVAVFLVVKERKVFTLSMLGIVVVMIAISLKSSTLPGIQIGRDTFVGRTRLAYDIVNYRIAPDEELLKLFPHAIRVRNDGAFLEKYHLNAFKYVAAEALALAAAKPIDAEPLMAFDEHCYRFADKAVIIEGPWAVDEKNKQAAGAVYLRLNQKTYKMLYGICRQDVADSLGVAKYKYSGFYGLLPLDQFVPGKNLLECIVLSHDQKAYYTPKVVEINLPARNSNQP